MTKVKITKRGTRIISFELSGHAGYAQRGSDIVCAAISMAVHMTITGLEDVAGVKFGLIEEPEGGYVMLRLYDPAHVQAHTLAKTLELSLQALAEQYPENIQVLTCDT